MEKQKKRHIKNKDIYFLQVVGDKIIVNNNYEGISVYDKELNKIKDIKLYDEIIIYNSIVINEKELLLICPDDEKKVHVNVNDEIAKIMSFSIDLERELLAKFEENEDIIVDISESNLRIAGANELQELVPDDNYYFREAKVMYSLEGWYVIVLSNHVIDEEDSIITVIRL